jgi:hypothetical protein
VHLTCIANATIWQHASVELYELCAYVILENFVYHCPVLYGLPCSKIKYGVYLSCA